MKALKGSRQLVVTSLAVLVVLLISLSWALADPSPSLEEWNRTFGDPEDAYGGPVRETSDGGHIITGTIHSGSTDEYDVYLVKMGSHVSEEGTYSASIVLLEAPSEVYPGASFTVNLTVSYGFNIPTEMGAGITDDVETVDWLALEYEDLVGEGTRTYSFELTAPEEETTWALMASVGYYSDGEWMHDEVDWVEPFDIQVREEEGKYSASIVLLEAPSEVYSGESFTVEITVSYGFTAPTELGFPIPITMGTGIKEVETGAWLEGLEYEDLVGEGTRTYSFELTAPEEETTWALMAIVRYYSEGEWMHDEVDWVESFDIQVRERDEKGGGIPGFPFEAIIIGLLIGFSLLSRRASLQS